MTSVRETERTREMTKELKAASSAIIGIQLTVCGGEGREGVGGEGRGGEGREGEERGGKGERGGVTKKAIVFNLNCYCRPAQFKP